MRKGPALVLITALLVAVPTVAPAATVAVDDSGASSEASAAVDAAIATWESFFSARSDCTSAVTVSFEVLDGRKGEYRTATAEVVINPDRDPSTMAYTTFHELSHHVMISCRAYRDDEFAEVFFDAQGIPDGRGWFDHSQGWTGMPAEHFAEVAAHAIQGWSDGRIPISGDAVAVIKAWASAQSIPATTTWPPSAPAVAPPEPPAPSAPEAVTEALVIEEPAAAPTDVDDTVPDPASAPSPTPAPESVKVPTERQRLIADYLESICTCGETLIEDFKQVWAAEQVPA